MGSYKKAVITEQGKELLAKVLAGDAVIQFSHASTSAYSYPDGTDFTKLAELKEIKQTVVPSDVRIAGTDMVHVRVMFENNQVIKSYQIQTIGIYAIDGENEILFSVSQAEIPDEVPAYNGVAPSSFIFNIFLTIAQASEVHVEVLEAGGATVQEILEMKRFLEVKLLAENWTGSAAPYSQTVAVAAIKKGDNPLLVSALEDGASVATHTAYEKAFGIISSGTAITENGSVTFKVYKKPITDIMVGLRGV